MLSVSIFWCFGFAGELKSASVEAIGVWFFDEGNGNTVKDVSGNGHHGEIIGEVVWVDGNMLIK